MLAAVPGLELIELKESEICCGSAGICNVVHNDLAEKPLQNKMRRIEETKAELILTPNPGCLLQLRAGVSRAGGERRVLHVGELLDEAYGGSTAFPLQEPERMQARPATWGLSSGQHFMDLFSVHCMMMLSIKCGK